LFGCATSDDSMFYIGYVRFPSYNFHPIILVIM
jgi:hypothetical protein